LQLGDQGGLEGDADAEIDLSFGQPGHLPGGWGVGVRVVTGLDQGLHLYPVAADPRGQKFFREDGDKNLQLRDRFRGAGRQGGTEQTEEKHKGRAPQGLKYAHGRATLLCS